MLRDTTLLLKLQEPQGVDRGAVAARFWIRTPPLAIW